MNSNKEGLNVSGNMVKNSDANPFEPNACVLCNMERPLTAEHIFADWIGRTTGYTSKKSIQTLLTAGVFKHSTIPGNHAERKLKVLCNQCNNEWGSRLQNKTSPILKQLILGHRYDLSIREQEQIARWLTCFVMVREFVHPEVKTISQETRSKFRKSSSIPRGMAIWMAPFSGTRSNLATWHRVFKTSRFDLQKPSPDTYFTLLVISRVLFFVFGSSNKSFADLDKPEISALSSCLGEIGLRQIWPTQRTRNSHSILDDSHFENIISAATDAISNRHLCLALSSWNGA